jgi:8-oxo-dGTP pyrophosphatase MutT (NUDIX family)
VTEPAADASVSLGDVVAHRPDPAVVAAHAHLHADALDELQRWAAPDPGQARLRDRYVDHLRAHADATAKAGPPAHLTASCLVLDRTGEHVLLTLHRRAGEWFQFGGHLEPGDASLWHAARREGREESGIDDLEPAAVPVQLDRHVLVGAFGRCREHLDVRYAAVARPGALVRVGEESHDVRWWPVEALPPGTRAELTPLVSLAREALLRR